MDILWQWLQMVLTATIAGTSEGVDPIMSRFFLEEKKGSIVPKTAPQLCDDNYWYYNSAYNIDQEWCVKINGIRQRHIDQRTIVQFIYNNKLYNEGYNESLC